MAVMKVRVARAHSSDLFHGCFGVREPATSSENGQTREKHPGVADKGGSKVSGEAVLRDSRVRARSKQIILETRLDHPPADDTLETNQCRDSSKIQCHFGCNFATSDEVGGRNDKGQANEATPDTVKPFHKVDLLKFFKVHMRVEKLELGRCTVLFELGLPIFFGHGRKRTSDRSPFSDTQAVLTLAGYPIVCNRRREAYPDSVKRVRPPKTTIPKTLTALPRSQ
jgi:hypothetical protein